MSPVVASSTVVATASFFAALRLSRDATLYRNALECLRGQFPGLGTQTCRLLGDLGLSLVPVVGLGVAYWRMIRAQSRLGALLQDSHKAQVGAQSFGVNAGRTVDAHMRVTCIPTPLGRRPLSLPDGGGTEIPGCDLFIPD